jgi:hypothetical protein
MGVLYAYNYYNMARLTRDYVAVTGDTGLLLEKVRGQEVLDYLYAFCLSAEDLNNDPVLIDYGNNHNLLELKRTDGYTHYTPSPNGERVLTYQLITEMFEWLGRETPHDLQARAMQLKKVYVDKLWNEQDHWLYALDARGRLQTAYSIQVFDVLRSGILSESQETGILSHLKEGEFLSEWGVHSLSITDPGYDPGDVDWGGPGVFAGDAPELVTDLLHAGYGDKGIDLLRRILWWGDMPYYPQAIRANEKGYRENGRPNVIAGLGAAQCILVGLFGVRVELDRITVKPVKHEFMRGLGLGNIGIRDVHFSVTVDGDAKFYTVSAGGVEAVVPLGEEFVIPLSSK